MDPTRWNVGVLFTMPLHDWLLNKHNPAFQELEIIEDELDISVDWKAVARG